MGKISKKIINFFKRKNKFILVDETWTNTYEGKVAVVEQLIAMGEGIKATANKIDKGEDIMSIWFGKTDEKDVVSNYKDWSKTGKKELLKIFSSPRNSSKFDNYTMPKKESSRWLPTGRITMADVEKLARGKVKLLEGMLKELEEKRPVEKPSFLNKLLKHPLFVGVTVPLLLYLLRIAFYLATGRNFSDIPFP